MLNRPYIGVTGIMCEGQTDRLLSGFTPTSTHVLMAGILVSGSSLTSAPLLPNIACRYPNVRDIANIIDEPKNPRVRRIIHYSPKGSHGLGPDLKHIHELWGDKIDGLQLNVVWPEPGLMGAYRKIIGSDKTLIFQLNSDAMRAAGGSPRKMVERFRRYGDDVFNAILIDQSCGTGKPFVPEEVAPYVNEIAKSGLRVSVAVAGGLSPNSMSHLSRLRKMTPGVPLSTDAEHSLRSQGDRGDYLDIQRALIYIRKAQRMPLA